MSLIQDALKRQLEENAEIQISEIPQKILAPAADEEKIRPFSVTLIAVLIAAVIAVLTGLGIYLLKSKPSGKVTPEPIAKSRISVTDSKPVAAKGTPVPEDKAAADISANKAPEAKTVIIAAKKTEPVPAISTEWPALTLTGIAQGDNQSIAILNGKMLTAGRTLGEVTVKEVHETDVVVEYRGESRVLYLNE